MTDFLSNVVRRGAGIEGRPARSARPAERLDLEEEVPAPRPEAEAAAAAQPPVRSPEGGKRQDAKDAKIEHAGIEKRQEADDSEPGTSPDPNPNPPLASLAPWRFPLRPPAPTPRTTRPAPRDAGPAVAPTLRADPGGDATPPTARPPAPATPLTPAALDRPLRSALTPVGVSPAARVVWPELPARPPGPGPVAVHIARVEVIQPPPPAPPPPPAARRQPTGFAALTAARRYRDRRWT